jgi:alpha-tubulin suppressor-like RCC1 family protein
MRTATRSARVLGCCLVFVCLSCDRSQDGSDGGTGPDDQSCGNRRCDLHASCVTTQPGRPHCECAPGFTGDGLTCDDEDECKDSSACDPMAECRNSSGSFSCTCVEGYTKAADQSCVDIDECERAHCDALVSCDNQPGSFACGACPNGHWGSGTKNVVCIGKVTAAAAGSYHTCAILANGSVKCWGTNLVGELGLGDKLARGGAPADLGDALRPVELGTGRSAIALSAGESHTCALLDDAEIKCWGANDVGQLGLGDTQSRGDEADELGDRLAAVSLGTGPAPSAIAAGSGHTCALLEGGRIKCWGGNESGQLGLGDTDARGDAPDQMGDELPFVELGAGRHAVALAAGGAQSCALLDDASIKCWGANEAGQLGLGDTDARGDAPGEMGDALPSVMLGAGRHPVAIAVSAAAHACALLDEGSVTCWGANDYGQLGLGDTARRGAGPGELGDALPAIALGMGRHALSIALGGGQSCASLDDATTKCWGYNDYANLGLGDFEERGDQPGEMGDALPAIDLGQGRTAAALVPSKVNHTCAILDNGAMKCWGSNGLGQLGHGDMQSRGGKPGEMGDNLPSVNLGHLVP